MSKTVFTLGSRNHSSFLYSLGFAETNFNSAKVVMFTGGEDVSPEYYRQSVGRYTHNNIFRDKREFEYFNRAVSAGKILVGICRGFQAIHAFQGFPLVQHMSGHNSVIHKIIATDGSYEFAAPGDHHQNPLAVPEMDILAVADILSPTHLNGNNEEIILPENYRDVEVGFYPEIKGLGFQYHPEWSDPESQCFINTKKIFSNVFRF